jgi:hypothetical protein
VGPCLVLQRSQDLLESRIEIDADIGSLSGIGNLQSALGDEGSVLARHKGKAIGKSMAKAKPKSGQAKKKNSQDPELARLGRIGGNQEKPG